MLDAGGKAIILRDAALRRNNAAASRKAHWTGDFSAPTSVRCRAATGDFHSIGAKHGGQVRILESCCDNHVKLHLDRPGATNLITAFDPGSVMVNQTRFGASMIVLADRVIDTWGPHSFDALTDADFETLAGLGADIVLLGTGRTLRFPHPRLASRLLSRRIGLEAMDTAAACRTYNILSGEGRNVAAALIIE